MVFPIIAAAAIVGSMLISQAENAASNASADAASALRLQMARLVDEKIYPLAKDIDYMLQNRIEQGENAAKDVVKYTSEEIQNLEEKFQSDLKDLLNQVKADYKDSLRLTFAEINKARAEAIEGLRKTVGDLDKSLYNRINQFSKLMMETLKTAKEISDKFDPDRVRLKLIDPTLEKLAALEAQVVGDVNQVLDRIETIVDKELDTVRGELSAIKNDILRFRLTALKSLKSSPILLPVLWVMLPNLLEVDRWDECMKQLKYEKPVDDLTQLELYRLKNCYIERQLDNNFETTSVRRIMDTYVSLQHNASVMRRILIGDSNGTDTCVRDWLEYGRRYRLWKEFC